MKYALQLEHVTKKYPGFCLKDVSLALPTGCIMGFIGENGAGKSTTIKAILDLIRIDSGKISVLNRPMCREVREELGVVMDESNFPDDLNALDTNAVMKRIYRTWDEARYFDWIKRFSLPCKKRVKEFSRGMRMKLSIAVALSHDSRLLLLDEATSGLDPIARDELLDVLMEFIQDETHSVLISSHIISDLEKICDYITFIHKGRIYFSQAKDALLETYGILKCSKAELARIDQGAIHGVKVNQFGVEALVERSKVRPGLPMDRAGIEDIMVFIVREAGR